MSPTQTTSEAIEALALELDEIEWFGRATMFAAPARVGPLDLLLFMMGGALEAPGTEDQLCPAR
jgi:hypothetical protein